MLRYGFRNKNGKAIVAYWMAAHSVPGGAFPPLTMNLTLGKLRNPNPVLIDVVSGRNHAAGMEDKARRIRWSACRCATACWRSPMPSYFDWPVLPEAPSGLGAHSSSSGVELHWEPHGGSPSKIVIERRAGNTGARWERIATESGTQFKDTSAPSGSVVCYRVRATNAAGESAFSNIARVNR